ncbi:hypothetical protein CVT25_007282 [Psilocybe cyanescens]|uniref:Uncharacterized protein n=1 Tax=Psilocybe cyanescens TaxID=93625 RepID=A0A409XPE5_PSICY|nr:hypothetical protein CVT25_007282 [Psilocybe cyanescens]
MDKPYGRNRQSVADIERELYRVFEEHPDCTTNEQGEPSVPGDSVFSILEIFADLYNGTPLLSEEETAALRDLVNQHQGIQVTPPLLLQLVAEKTKAVTPPRSPMHDSNSSEDERDGYGHTRTLSNESTGTSYRPDPHSRPPSRGPTTPSSLKSPLDSDRRQRSTPLNSAPSSWAKRPTPAGRRKSDAGNRSDSESGGPPVSWGRAPRDRARTPSNPASPTSSSRELSFSPGSPDFGRRSRPHSRAQSQPQNTFNNNLFDDYSSPDDTVKRPGARYGYDFNDSFGNVVSTLTMPRSGDDSDDDDMDAGLVHDRSIALSTVSMEVSERIEALTRTNDQLGRKVVELETTLQNKLAEHELELEETHQRLEELRSELSASNREEKELRAKDSRNMAQITALEAEVAKVQKALDSAKATYSSLQRQYQEQCSASEKYRDDLRKREETIRSLKDAVSLHEIETGKWTKEHESYEDRIAQLEIELSTALEAHTHLDEQKQENMLLKETIDRMRFDMDELRNAMTAVGAAGSNQSSAANTMSKSLGAELANVRWNIDPEESPEPEGYQSGDNTAVEEEETEEEDDEDVIQTIITKRKRKVASRANIMPSTRQTFDELKEYSDFGTQYDPTEFAVNHGVQTEFELKPVKTSFSIQTDEIPQPKPVPAAPPRITVEMEIQTEEAAEEPSRSPSPAHDESMASSSSTIVPPTPKALPKPLDHLDEPPAYNQVTEADKEERKWRLAAEATLKEWHHGAKIPLEPIAGGVSEETVEEWKALKQELGVECTVIDKIIAASDKTPRKDPKPRRNRFYNIYNTYVYGDKNATSPTTSQVITYLSVGALAVFAVTPYIMPHNSIPGGVTYADRAAWNSFNAMPGDTADGTTAVLEIIRRLTGGAARYARGWPT